MATTLVLGGGGGGGDSSLVTVSFTDWLVWLTGSLEDFVDSSCCLSACGRGCMVSATIGLASTAGISTAK